MNKICVKVEISRRGKETKKIKGLGHLGGPNSGLGTVSIETGVVSFLLEVAADNLIFFGNERWVGIQNQGLQGQFCLAGSIAIGFAMSCMLQTTRLVPTCCLVLGQHLCLLDSILFCTVQDQLNFGLSRSGTLLIWPTWSWVSQSGPWPGAMIWSRG
jgi:hypothetical protein